MVDNIRVMAYSVVNDTLKRGVAEGHNEASWSLEPIQMHGLKAIRHMTTMLGLLDHPEFFKDREAALLHAEAALTRSAMALATLREHLRKQGSHKFGKGSDEGQ